MVDFCESDERNPSWQGENWKHRHTKHWETVYFLPPTKLLEESFSVCDLVPPARSCSSGFYFACPYTMQHFESPRVVFPNPSKRGLPCAQRE